jgi:hypothetical protein
MKITKSNNTKKNIFIAFGVALLISGMGILGAYYFKKGVFTPRLDGGINLSEPSDSQLKAGTETKKQTVASDKSRAQVGSDQPPMPTPQPGSSKSNVEVTITAANQNNTTLQIRTLISAVVNSGSCILTFANNSGKNLTYTASIQPLSTTSTCKGFDIPTSDLSPGSWSITVAYNNDTLTGSASKNITIK